MEVKQRELAFNKKEQMRKKWEKQSGRIWGGLEGSVKGGKVREKLENGGELLVSMPTVSV